MPPVKQRVVKRTCYHLHQLKYVLSRFWFYAELRFSLQIKTQTRKLTVQHTRHMNSVPADKIHFAPKTSDGMINLHINGLPDCKVFPEALKWAGQKLRNHLHRTHPFAFKCSVCLFHCGNRSNNGAPGGAHNEYVCEWLSGWLFAQWSAWFSMPRWVFLSQLFPITDAAESARAAFYIVARSEPQARTQNAAT